MKDVNKNTDSLNGYYTKAEANRLFDGIEQTHNNTKWYLDQIDKQLRETKTLNNEMIKCFIERDYGTIDDKTNKFSFTHKKKGWLRK